MKKSILKLILTVFVLSFMNQTIYCQLDGWNNKINWSFKLQKDDESHATIVATAKISSGWHVFSTNHDPNKADLTGYPTTFKFPKSINYKLIGKLSDGAKAIVHEDELGTSLYFENTAIFKQKIEVLTDKPFELVFDYSFCKCSTFGCNFNKINPIRSV